MLMFLLEKKVLSLADALSIWQLFAGTLGKPRKAGSYEGNSLESMLCVDAGYDHGYGVATFVGHRVDNSALRTFPGPRCPASQ